MDDDLLFFEPVWIREASVSEIWPRYQAYRSSDPISDGLDTCWRHELQLIKWVVSLKIKLICFNID